MRGLVVVLVTLLAASTRADTLRVRDPEALLPDLKTLTVTTFESRNGKQVQVGRETRAYDKAGQIKSVQHHRDNELIVRTTYVWSTGRLATRTHREPSGRVVTRHFTYKVDGGNRVIETTVRDPRATDGERHVTTTIWHTDGSRGERTARHLTSQGPYPTGSAAYDASGRLETRCGSGWCSTFEYDAHGNVDRIRQQQGDEHYYLVYDLAYDASGRLQTSKRGNVETTFVYDRHGDVVEERRSDGSATVYVYGRR